MLSKEMKQVVFLAVVLMFFIGAIVAIQYRDFLVKNALPLLLIAAVMIAIWKYDFLIMLKEYERAVISRFGKINRVSGPGWCFILPPFETFTVVDLRTITLDIPKQDVITKDKVLLKIDAIIYIKVKKDDQSVINSVMEVNDYKRATILYVIAKTRDVIGSMNFDDVISNIENLNVELRKGLEEISKNWGIACDSVEIKDVDVPEEVMSAMHRSKAAIQDKMTRIEQAAAQSAEIEAVRDAAEKLSDKAIAYYYIKALEELGKGKSTKFIFPLELSKLASLISDKTVGKPEGASSADVEKLLKEYAPLIKAAVDGENNSAKPEEKKNAKKDNQ